MHRVMMLQLVTLEEIEAEVDRHIATSIEASLYYEHRIVALNTLRDFINSLPKGERPGAIDQGKLNARTVKQFLEGSTEYNYAMMRGLIDEGASSTFAPVAMHRVRYQTYQEILQSIIKAEKEPC